MNARAIGFRAHCVEMAKTYGRTILVAIILATGLAAPIPLLAVSTAHAGWREDMGVFRIGIVARPGAGAVIEGSKPIQDAFAEVLGMPVGIYVARDYADLIDAQASGRVDYAVHTAASYATLSIQCNCVAPLVAPVSADGSDGTSSVLLSRQGGPVNADDVPNYKVAFGPEDSATGALLPRAQFRPNRKSLTGSEPYLVAVESEADGLSRFVSGEVDAIFGYAATARGKVLPGSTLQMVEAGGLATAKVLWTSRPLRHGPHAIRRSLSADARELLVPFLTGLKDADERVYDYLERRFAGGFVPADEAEYQSAIEMVRINTGVQPGN